MSAAYQGRSTNEHGVAVAHFICRACKREYSVCPHPDPGGVEGWRRRGCTGPDCSTYDMSVDVDLMIASGMTLSAGGS